MKITQLPSGNYRVQPVSNCKRVSLTFDHKPTDKEIMRALIDKTSHQEDENASETHLKAQKRHCFEQCVKDYIELKKDRNSPRTIKEYGNLCHRFSSAFNNKDISKITQLDVDKEVARWLADGLAWKTMKNYFSMMQTVIKKYGGATYSMDMLPEKPKKLDEPYIPTSDDVKRMLEYIREHYPMMYVPFWLSCYGLRRGEVVALTVNDVDAKSGTISINKDMVQDSDLNWIVKEPKTQASKREIAISKDLCKLIVEQGYVYNGNPHSINKALKRTQDALGIPRFNLHKMRHYCCTELFDMGYTETDVMAYMGWEEESECMRQVYKHSRLRTSAERQRELADKLSGKLDVK